MKAGHPTPGGAALDALRKLGDVEQLAAAAGRGLAPARRPKVNSHVHLPPNFSAFQSVRQAVDLAAQQGVTVLGASNYYHYGVYADFAAAAEARGVFPLFGLEIIALIDELREAGVKVNDPGNPGRMYLCGKGITRFEPMSPRAGELVETIRRNDKQRMAEMIRLIEAIFAGAGQATGLDESAIVARVARRHGCPAQTVYLQERHVAQAFQEVFFEKVPAGRRAQRLSEILGAPVAADDPLKVQNDLRSRLMKAGKPAFVGEAFLNFQQARELVLQLGGIPCYPTLADGTQPLCAYEEPVEKLIDSLAARGIHCAEFIPVRNQPQVLERYVRAMRRAGLVVTAGTEHNTLELGAMEPACVGGQPICEELKEIFWEGACVVAAHQFLGLHGRCGYVDAAGAPAEGFASVEERIVAFRELGAAVIERYYQTHPSKE